MRPDCYIFESKLFMAKPITDDMQVEKLVKVRLLTDGRHGKANHVAELPASIAKKLEVNGQADSHKAAIDYALSLLSTTA